MTTINKNTFLNFIKFFVSGVFLSISEGHACVDLDISNQTDKPAVLKSFSRNYSDLMVTSDMEFDPAEELTLDILIQYDRLIQYWKELRKMGIIGFSEDKKDYMEFTVGEDDFIVSWDQHSVASLRATHADSYDARLDFISEVRDNPTKKRYKLTLTKK